MVTYLKQRVEALRLGQRDLLTALNKRNDTIRELEDRVLTLERKLDEVTS